jgi:hypothetical protein
MRMLIVVIALVIMMAGVKFFFTCDLKKKRKKGNQCDPKARGRPVTTVGDSAGHNPKLPFYNNNGNRYAHNLLLTV